MTHDKIQSEFYTYIHNNIPSLRDLLFANYNNPRNAIQGGQLKGIGLRKGRPDIEFLFNGKTYLIELKITPDSLSKEQKIVISRLNEHNFDVYVVFDDSNALLSVLFNIIKSVRNWQRFFNYKEVAIIENFEHKETYKIIKYDNKKAGQQGENC